MKCTDVTEVQSKDLLASSVIGIVSVFSEEQPSNASEPKDETESGIVIVFSEEQLYPAYAQIFVTVSGTENEVTLEGMWYSVFLSLLYSTPDSEINDELSEMRDSHPLNAPTAIDVTDDGIDTVGTFQQLLANELLRDFTPLDIVIDVIVL